MTIVSDRHIPFLVEAVRTAWPQVQICPMESEVIDASAVRHADALVVRTRTRIDETLLSNAHVQLVCTATIGYDHIDTAWCDAHGVHWTACPGCNAQAVCDYIEEALDEYLASGLCKPLSCPPTIGVVGVGHVGSLVVHMVQQKGLRVVYNDPPKQIGISLDEIAQTCDIITFHTPLTTSGPYPTFHLCDEAFLSCCRPGALIINAARGGVVDEQALLQSEHPYILDTWEDEPHIRPDVLQNAFRASMHIAGYSVEGKRNATQMCLDAIARHFSLPPINLPPQPSDGDTQQGWLQRITMQLKAQPAQFEQLRKSYSLR